MTKFIAIIFSFFAVLFIHTTAFSQTNLYIDDELSELANQMVAELPDNPKQKVAVIEFSEENTLNGQITELGKFISEELTTKFFISKKFNVIERQLLNKILAEHKLSITGIVDENTAKQLGSILGVDAICTGTITDLETTIKLNARLISTETGSIINAGSVRIQKDGDIEKLISKGLETPGQPIQTTSTNQASQAVDNGNVLFFDDFESGDLKNWQVLGGDWFAMDGKLVQNGKHKPAYILAGKSEWEDYCFEVEAERIDGTHGFMFVVHSPDSKKAIALNLGGWSNSRTALLLYSNLMGSSSIFNQTSCSVQVKSDRKYKVKIVIEGSSIKCYLDSALIIDFTDPEIYKLRNGKIGLGTWDTRAYFDNVKVTKLD